MKYKVKLFFLLIILLCGCGGKTQTETIEYAVLIGEGPDSKDKISNVDTLVIDADYFEKEDIAALKRNGIKEIYSYLNVGSIEEFRIYYDSYVNLALEDYENWPDEKWVDVSQKEWQQFIADRVAVLSDKGIDGFFVDNLDVYYKYPRDEIYEGLLSILTHIRNAKMEVIINGGDCFVRRYLESGENQGILFSAVNQESVYSLYDFENKKFTVNSEETIKYNTEYLDFVADKGLKVYTVEYVTDDGIYSECINFAGDHGYICYISDNIELKLNK